MTQCHAHTRTGAPCKRAAVRGALVCGQHGGAAPQVRQAAAVATLQRDLEKFVKPIDPAVHPDGDPFAGLYNSYLRCVGRIEWLEGEISKLTPEELIWGRTERQVTTAGEFPGTTTTESARVHLYLALLEKENQLRIRLTEAMAKNAFAATRLAIQQRQREYVYGKIIDAARALGHDPDDPVTRTKLARLFMGQDQQQELR